ncbi:MAG: arginase [Acidobacteriota bacterium]|jgi:arginase|nr:arginase [Acidobacteriota bacterium]
MSGIPLDLVVIPWDVERDDTGMARGPCELMARGFPGRLRAAGRDVREISIQPGSQETSKAAVVTGIGRGIVRAVAQARSEGRFPLILSGGCLAAVGALGGLQAGGGDPGVLWLDAHGDFNTPESSLSGYWDGMALATVCGLSLPEIRDAIGLHPLGVDQVLHLAGRAFDPLEIENIRRSGLDLLPAAGIAAGEAREGIGRRAGDGAWYLHLDLDGFDPRDAPAVGFPVPEGARLDDLIAALGALPPPAAMTFSALSFDRADEEEAERTIGACLRLVEVFARARPGLKPP